MYPIRKFKRLKSTRKYVERAEARLHRLAASCTLAVRDLNEDRISDQEQQYLRANMDDTVNLLNRALEILAESKKRAARANLAQSRPIVGVSGTGHLVDRLP